MAHPPGMPILVASILYLFGIKPDVFIQALGIFFDLIAVWMLYWIAKTLFNDKVAFIGGMLYAIFPPLARSSISMEPDGLITVFVITSFFCLFKSTFYRNWLMWIWLSLSGIVLGLGSYLRPDFMLMPTFMVFGIWAYTRRFFRSLYTIALVQIIVLLTLFPWAYRNYTLTDRWIFSSTMVGAVLITGLGEFTNPWGFGHMDEHREQQATRQGLASAWISDADLYFRELFFRSIINNPIAYLISIIKRIPLVIATPYEFGFSNPWKVRRFHELRYEGMDMYQTILSRPLYIIAAYFDYILMGIFNIICFFSLIVVFSKDWNRRGLIFFLMCPHFYNIISHILTHMEARFLLPTIYCLLIALAYALVNRFHKTNDLTVDSH
jgi:4-amino-4-deoxy-L-arabinose transferase-like glycosyltransferase